MSPRRPPKSRVLLEGTIPGRWIVGVLVALVVILVVAVVGFSSLNRIATCDVCHVIRPEVTAYKHSAHYAAGVKCQQCHTKPGVFNYFIRNLQGMTNLIAYVSGKYQRPITSYVGDANCVQCHPNSQIEQDLVVGNIRVNHKGLRQAGYQCMACHSNISHPSTQLAIARVSQNKMSICARCHNGKQLPDTCSTCHINGVPASAPKVAMRLQLTSAQCAECHKGEVLCSKCHHGLQMPHPEHWRSEHGAVVVQRGKSICVSCHLQKDPTFCITCHKLPMPHPAGWTSQHGGYALKHQDVCVNCHGRDSCMACHGLQMPHPADWLATHPSTASSSPGLCAKCHSDSFCVACHGVVLPHTKAFIADHPNHVYTSGSICMKCHGNGGTGPEGCYGGQCHSGSIP